MSTSENINLCIRSIGTEQDWRNLYELSFTRDERMSLEELDVMIKRQLVLVHRTTDNEGNLLCFSIVTPMSNFSLLAYIATDQTRRSSGVGSKHMRALIALLKKSYPSHRGLFLEIESTRETKISPAEEVERKRRLAFYERLGCKRLIGADYLLPSYVPGSPARQGELLWFEYHDNLATDSRDTHSLLGSIICEIYIRGYGVSHRDDSFVHVMKQFPGVDDTTCSIIIADAEVASTAPVVPTQPTVSPVQVPDKPTKPVAFVARFIDLLKRLKGKLGL